MTIYHKIDSFLYELFPGTEDDQNQLIERVKAYYSYAAFEPQVSIEEGILRVDIDTSAIISQEADFRKAVTLCEQRKFDTAKPIVESLIKKNPTNSEFHRIYGQLLSEQGNQDAAIDALIDALRWNPKNGFALLMMGNVYARYKGDVATARVFYDQALKVNPNDNIAINNIGSNLMQMGKVQEGIEYLEKAYAIDPDFPNTSFGLSMGYELLGYPFMAFEFAVEAVKKSKSNPDLHKVAQSHLFKVAKMATQDNDGMRIVEEYRSHLTDLCGKEIRMEADDTIPTAAKFEFAENYDRDYHQVKYKNGYPAVAHLIMHELVHLEFATEARKERANLLFISGSDRRIRFFRDNEGDIKRLKKTGFDEQSIARFMDGLYDGINRQLYNTPIDLFIEDYLYEHYKELRPHQFVSLLALLEEGKAAVTSKQAIDLTPKFVFSASMVLNLLNAFMLRELYGIDTVKQFGALPYQLKAAEIMWGEWLDYRKDREPGEEYEIVKHWGEDLRLQDYYELVDEVDFRNRPKTVEDILQSAIEDPHGLNQDQNFKDRETETFLKNQKEIGHNMAVVMFMVDALQYFAPKPRATVRQIAMEIAMIGTRGINPSDGSKYHVPSIAGKEFSGYHLLAYYYVSFKLVLPEVLPDLQLPFDEEFKMAEQLYGKQD